MNFLFNIFITFQPGYWNLGATPEGCEECGCDPGGSRNLTCDDISGHCSCRPHLIGRKCDQVRPGYHFANLDHTRYEGENAVPSETGVSQGFVYFVYKYLFTFQCTAITKNNYLQTINSKF